jgi:hypothetical protein
MRSIFLPLLGSIILLMSGWSISPADELPNEIQEDQDFLAKGLKIPTDSKSLLQRFRQQAEALGDANRLIQQLGDPSFEKREEASRRIIDLGLVMLPALQDHFDNPDKEIARRVRECIEPVRGSIAPDWVPAATRLLRHRKPEGGFEVLLNYLPFAQTEEAEEEIYYALDEYLQADADHLQVLLQSLNASRPESRALAACLLGVRGSDEHRAKVREVMKTDNSPLVRLRAAQAILSKRDNSAIPVLIELLLEPSIAIGWQAEELLSWSAVSPPKEMYGTGTAEERKACHLAWQQWWQQEQSDFAWPPATLRPGGPGLVFLYCLKEANPQGDHILVTGCDGRLRYKYFPLNITEDVLWLPSGRFVLLQDKTGLARSFRVEERDVGGKLQHQLSVEFPTTHWRRLQGGYYQFIQQAHPNGDLQVRTYDPKGNVRSSTQIAGKLRKVPIPNDPKPHVRLANGNTLGYEAGLEYLKCLRLVEWDRNDTAIWECLVQSPIDQAKVIYPLVRFGFSMPEGKATVDTLERRLRMLESPEPAVRLFALKQLRGFTWDDNTFQAILKAAQTANGQIRNRGDVFYGVQEEALAVLATDPKRCRRDLSPFLEMLAGEGKPGTAAGLHHVFRAVGPEAGLPALLADYHKHPGAEYIHRRANVMGELIEMYLGKDDRVHPTVAMALKDQSSLVRATVVDALGWHIGNERL